MPYAIKSALGYYAGPTELHTAEKVAPPRWQPEVNPFWLFGSKGAAEERIRQRGWEPGFAEAVEVEEPPRNRAAWESIR